MDKKVPKRKDPTAVERYKRRVKKIHDAGLKELKVTMHEDDVLAVREYAKKLYNKRGIKKD